MMETGRRINIGGINDDYVLGVLCEKTGLADYARESMPSLETDEDRGRLFALGMQDADGCALEDIAIELERARRKNPGLFDLIVRQSVGQERVAEIKATIMRKRKRRAKCTD